MAQEEFFSLPNMFWFAAGLGAEIVFLGIGVSPTGMEWGANIAESIGLIEPFNAVASVGAESAIASAAPIASTGSAFAEASPIASNGVEVLDF